MKGHRLSVAMDKYWFVVVLFFTLACQTFEQPPPQIPVRARKARPKSGPRRPFRKRMNPNKTARPSPAPLINGMRTGTVQSVSPNHLEIRGRRYPVAGAAITRSLKVGDRALVTLRASVVIDVDKFSQNPIQRSLKPPSPPAPGDLVSIDQVIGLVISVDGLKVHMRVKDGPKFIGKTTLTLRATTSLRILKAGRATDAPSSIVGDSLVASSLPEKGIFAKPLLQVAGNKQAKGEISLKLIAGKVAGKGCAVTVLVTNSGPRALRSYQLSLDFSGFGGAYNFGELRVSNTEEALLSGGRRRFSLQASPLLGTAGGFRVMISELEFE
jgi:hypothetical protein